MKTFILINRDDGPYLRQRNPLFENPNLVSAAEYLRFENLYIQGALFVVNPEPDKTEYYETEIVDTWQYFDGEVWGDIPGEPAYIGTDQDDYRYVYRVRDHEQMTFQENVKSWVSTTFGYDPSIDIQERSFRFIEEALETVQSLGLTKEDVLRVVIWTFGRPPGVHRANRRRRWAGQWLH